MATNFWTDSLSQDPKRNFRFLVRISSLEATATWYAKKVSRPNFTVEQTEHNYLNHTFYYPTRTKWDPVTLTLVDPVSPDAMNQILQIIKFSGYDPSALTTGNPVGTTNTKAAATGMLNSVEIEMIDGEANRLEMWTLNSPFITKVGMSELDYSNDDLASIDLELRYDWATCLTPNAAYKVAIPSGDEGKSMYSTVAASKPWTSGADPIF
jgi:hypothetical protein